MSRVPRASSSASPLASSGIPGFDEILRGGLPRDRVYLLEGEPGTGKTTAALQFLLEGVRQGESCLYVTLSETADELAAVAASHGWTLDGIDVFELVPNNVQDAETTQYSIFAPSEVELADTIKLVVQRVEAVNPSRVVIDSLAEFRLLAQEALWYRRQILAFKHFFVGRHSTVLLLDDRSGSRADLQVQSVAHGVINLEQLFVDYGEERRRLQVLKLRAVKYRGGYHDLRIETGGMRVFPRVSGQDGEQPEMVPMSSGIAELDRLLGGGLDTGTSTIVFGPAGTGKTVLATQYAATAARAGRKGAIYLFDERLNTFLHRSRALGLDVLPLAEEGRVSVQQLDPGQLTAGELAADIRDRVERDGVGLIVIDSLNGYLNAMQREAAVLVHLHDLLSYLNRRGVLTIITLAQQGIVGTTMAAPIDVSYLADTLIMLRFFEADGAVHKAISVVKKRTGHHEDVIREFRIEADRVRVGAPLTAFRGVLTGVPEYTGAAGPLFDVQTGGHAG